MGGGSESPLIAIYREWVGEPLTTGEAYSYWLFVLGSVLILPGMGSILSSIGGGQTGLREAGYLLAGAGISLALASRGLVEPRSRVVRWFVSAGLASCLAAVAWFSTVYPDRWALGSGTAQGVLSLYTAGLVVVTLSAVVAPALLERRRPRRAVSRTAGDARPGEAVANVDSSRFEGSVRSRSSVPTDSAEPVAEADPRSDTSPDGRADQTPRRSDRASPTNGRRRPRGSLETGREGGPDRSDRIGLRSGSADGDSPAATVRTPPSGSELDRPDPVPARVLRVGARAAVALGRSVPISSKKQLVVLLWTVFLVLVLLSFVH